MGGFLYSVLHFIGHAVSFVAKFLLQIPKNPDILKAVPILSLEEKLAGSSEEIAIFRAGFLAFK